MGTSREFLRLILERFTEIWGSLHAANTAFLQGAPTVERLLPLLDQRDLEIGELRALEAEFVRAARDLLGSAGDPGFPEGFRLLQERFPDLGDFARARTALRELAGSDRLVEERLRTVQQEVQTALKTMRRGSSLLKGYAQPDLMGSCFIDKIK